MLTFKLHPVPLAECGLMTSTPWFTVKPGLSVVVQEKSTGLKKVYFNVRKVTSYLIYFQLINNEGWATTFYYGEYRLTSIKQQACAIESESI